MLGCTDNRYMRRVPSRGDIANFCNQALACTTVEVRQDDRLYRRVVSPSIMGRCPDSGVSSCPAWTCGQKAPAGAGAGSKRSLGQPMTSGACHPARGRRRESREAGKPCLPLAMPVGLADLLFLRRLVTAPQNVVRGTNSSDEPKIRAVARIFAIISLKQWGIL